MDINRHKFHGNYQLSGYTDGKITVNDTVYKHSIIISKDTLIEDWAPQKVSQLEQDSIHCLIELNPEIIIIGTGNKHHFINEAILKVAFDKDIPVELMASNKACMLYTILIQEQKNVVAGIMP